MSQTDEVKAYMEQNGFILDGFGGHWYRDKPSYLNVNVSAAEFFYTAQKEAVRKVLDRVDKEVIGEDEDPKVKGNWPGRVYPHKLYRNELKAEQRQKLDSIIKELEG